MGCIYLRAYVSMLVVCLFVCKFVCLFVCLFEETLVVTTLLASPATAEPQGTEPSHRVKVSVFGKEKAPAYLGRRSPPLCTSRTNPCREGRRCRSCRRRRTWQANAGTTHTAKEVYIYVCTYHIRMLKTEKGQDVCERLLFLLLQLLRWKETRQE